jgi:5'-nucleotidase
MGAVRIGQMREMRILIVNDDGIYSPGLAALVGVARELGEVRVVAPDVEQSSAAQSISSSRPVRTRNTRLFEGVDAVRVNGTPSDCVALGLELWEGVDVVLSGVNLGPNLGNATWHSGTLAAARQAVLQGVRGIALSAVVVDEEPDFGRLQPWIRQVLQLLLADTGPSLVNVNFPDGEPQGLRWTAQAVEGYDGRIVAGEDAMGRRIYWFTVVPLRDPREGTDLWAVGQGLISLTPLRLDLTDRAELERRAT